MKNKPECKACPKRENCPQEITPPTLKEVNTAFSELAMIEDIIGHYTARLMINKSAGLQWVFFNMMANKHRELADQFDQMVPGDRTDDGIDWTKITSLRQLADSDEPEWFNDVKEV